MMIIIEYQDHIRGSEKLNFWSEISYIRVIGIRKFKLDNFLNMLQNLGKLPIFSL